MTGGELIPASAWVQAAFVCLFIVLVIVLITWFSKQSDKWQSFIEISNDRWRAFSKEQREENNCAIAEVNSGLGNLTKVTEGLVQEVREMRIESREITSALMAHDDQAKEILHIVQKPAPKPRTKKAANVPPAE